MLVHFSWGFSSNTYFKVCLVVQSFVSKPQIFNSNPILSNCFTYSFALPGHTKLLQLFILLFGPTQSAPPLFGEGFVHVRVRVREPTPQVLEQLLQDDH